MRITSRQSAVRTAIRRGSWVLALVALPLVDSNPYHLDVLTTAWLYALLALGLNMIVGFAGLLNL